MGTIEKRQIGNEDINWWDADTAASQFESETSTSRTLTLKQVGSDGPYWFNKFNAHFEETPFLDLHSFGAKGDGTTDDTQALRKAISRAATLGGGVIIGGGPQYNYYLGTEATVTSSNITIDMQGALMTGSGTRVYFRGTATTNGDWSHSLENCFFRNARIGDGTSGENSKGPRFFWCKNCGMENIVKNSPSGTGFNMYMCKNSYMRNIWSYDANYDLSHIGVLLLHCQDCLVDNVHVHDQAVQYAFQIKGGYNNVISNCSAKRIRDAGATVTVDHVFRDRGDSPNGTSSTAATYPYSTSATWDAADWKRACHDSVYINCVAASCSGKGFFAGESVRARFVNCVAASCESGFYIYNGVTGSAASEYGHELVGCKALGSLYHGYIINGINTRQHKRIKLLDCLSERSGRSGVYADYVDHLELDNVTVRRCNIGDSDTITRREGIYLTNCDYPVLRRCRAIDDRSTILHRRGIDLNETTCYMPVVENCYASGSQDYEIQVWMIGKYSNNLPYDGHAKVNKQNISSRANWNTNLWRMYGASGQLAYIEAEVIADRVDRIGTSTSGWGYWKLGGLYYWNSDASAKLQGSITSASIKSGATLSAEFYVANGSDVRLRCGASVGATVNFRTHVRCVPYIA